MASTKRGFPRFAWDSVSEALVTRLFYDAVEASAAEVAGANGGKPSEVWALSYASPGISDQAWSTVGLDDTYAILQGSLISSSGPWTDLTSGSLADPSAEGTAKTLWIRLLTKRWAPADDNPTFDFWLRLGYLGYSPVEEA